MLKKENALELKFFPIPATNTLNISGRKEDKEIQILNLKG